ncbi:MAG TPA: MBL fold metallo-hydrolase [Spirochaetota bacterium]|nr:MBL fold metallo-hydrolase [Spirochaetota bacterium]HPU88268.1 MBL fold metallo-hydrolase [Spirochaetota bacterium]
MNVTFWGTRGSLPAPIDASTVKTKIERVLADVRDGRFTAAELLEGGLAANYGHGAYGTYGGNTACVQVGDDDDFIILDAGSGLRELGNHLMRIGGSGRRIHILLSHLHWDHIQGFPFFVPAYIPGNRITFYGFHPDIERAFEVQQSAPWFPATLSMMASEKKFVHLEIGKTYGIGNFTVRGIEQEHPGTAYGYSIQHNGKKIVYSTDSEHKDGTPVEESPFVPFFRDADLLIFDAQYSLADADVVKRDWGHSSNILAVEFASLARAKRLVLFHMDPAKRDEDLDRILSETKKYAALFDDSYAFEIDVAYDGMAVDV